MKNGRGYFIVFFLLLLFPLYGGIIDLALPQLQGVSITTVLDKPTLKSTMDGTFQTTLGSFFEERLPGKNALLRLRGQSVYTLLHTSPNTHVVRGKDDYLFEPAYMKLQTQSDTPAPLPQIEALGQQLQRLQQKLAENDKELYIFLTPSKAHFLPEKIPFAYAIAGRKKPEASNYDNFMAMAEKNGLHVFDGVAYLTENEGSTECPLFYKGGTHWSRVWADKAALAFADFIAETGGHDLAKSTLTEEKTEECLYPDADIYSTCNLIQPSREQYYAAHIETTPGTERPNVLMRGGSFMFSLWTLAEQNIFGNVDYLENMTYRTRTEERSISKMDAYDEMALMSCLDKADMLILEVNEASINNMSFGLLEYLEQIQMQ
ncbi:MAG: hypothetical protein RR989_09090 [Ruthenibacterium sp.]